MVCTYKFKGDNGEEVTLTGKPAFKAYLANGGLEKFFPDRKFPWMSGEQASDNKPAAAPSQPAPSGNTIFTDEMAEKARALIRSKLSQLNSGPDPELFQAGIVLAGYHIEKGARVFADFARAMLADMGESVRPYLKQWYLGVKFDPRGAGLTGMSSASVVEAFNVNDITAEQPAAQPAVQQEEQPKTLVDAFYQHLKDGTLPRDNNGLRKLVAEIDDQSTKFVPIGMERSTSGVSLLVLAVQKSCHSRVQKASG